MKIKKLFKDIPNIEIKGSKECNIMGLCSDSRRAAPLDLFIARRGEAFDATEFIPDAISAGASAVLTDFYNPFINIVQVIAKEVTRDLEGLIASRFYDYPCNKLNLIGITGTSGKTTMAYMIRHLLMPKVGLIGTIETITGRGHFQSDLTTPDAASLQRILKDIYQAGCHSAVMEVSSHALDQGRLLHTQFDRLIFTNLSNDHLDYHGDMERYFEAKAKFFTPGYMKKGAKAVVCIDCPYGRRLSVDKVTYGFDKEAMVRAEDVKISMEGSIFTLCLPSGERGEIFLPLLGRHNVLNAIGAVAAVDLPLKEIQKRLSSIEPVKGRMQKVQGSNIIIDYSHKPDALERVLLTLKEVAKGKIITVFGAGGDRDKLKRPMMGEIASTLSDVIIMTSDNPRSEDPMQIIEEIKKGVKGLSIVEVDREAAIKKAIEMAKPEDVVLIAGKGHESRQIFRHTTIDFDDYKVAEGIWKKSLF